MCSYATAAVTPDDVADHGGRCPRHLDTNGDLSACELSSTLGRGLMDLDAATRPVGEPSIALGSVLSGPQVAAGTSFLVTGRAMGNAVSSAFNRNFHFELPLHPKTYACYPVVSTANSSGLFEVVVGRFWCR